MNRPDARPAEEPSTQVVRRPIAIRPPIGTAACVVQIYPTNHHAGARHVLGTDPLLIGRDPKCHIELDDDTVSRFHAHLVRKEDDYYLSDYRSVNGTFLNDEKFVVRKLQDGDYLRIGRHIFRFLRGENVENLYHEEIYRLALTDGLTGLANHRALSEFLDRELSRAARYSQPLSVVLFDIDHFKKVNDHFGHLAGDYLLRELAARLRQSVRLEELMARYGGEEFALVLPQCDSLHATQAAERLRRLVASEPFLINSASHVLTLSLGVATTTGGEQLTVAALLQRADTNLYRAKEAGRNCYVS